MQVVLIISCFICKVSYYLVFAMQSGAAGPCYLHPARLLHEAVGAPRHHRDVAVQGGGVLQLPISKFPGGWNSIVLDKEITEITARP